MKLHLFNPENDLALAAGNAGYTPPRAAVDLHRAAALLPLWYADPGDHVYAPEADAAWADSMNRRFGLGVSVGSEGIPAPWGWSAHAVRQFRAIGIDGPFPDTEVLRGLSHRRTAMLLHRRLSAASSLPYQLPPEPQEITDLSQLPQGNDFFIKAPWSSSGRGVADCSCMPRRQVERLCAGIIRRQGSVMVEPRLDRLRDFAMLFRSDGAGTVSYCGLSLFFNSSACAYGGNIVAPQPQLAEILGCDHLDVTARAVSEALSEIVGSLYCGPLGVDMMLYRAADGRTLICPTVEVNLRMTMGFVAQSLCRFAAGPSVFSITSGASVSAGLSLLPPDPNFSFSLRPVEVSCLNNKKNDRFST